MAEIYKGMVLGNGTVFELALQGRARRYTLINIVTLGICFGLSNFYGALQTTPELPLSGAYMFITPLIFSAAGIVTMSGALIACTLVYWAAARAFGGPGGLGVIADLIGLAAIPFWILAPLLNIQMRFAPVGVSRILILSCIGAAFLWSFHVIRQSMVTGQSISLQRATIAVAAMWIFSISAVYVYLPQP
ncbi:MAG: hypothetical protein ABR512_02920 [Desulfopila sp.]